MTEELRKQRKEKDSAETQNRFFSRKKMMKDGSIHELKPASFFKGLNRPGSPDVGNRM